MTLTAFPRRVPPHRWVDPTTKPGDWAPSLHAHYRHFDATTSPSAPVLRIGTRALVGLPLELLPSHWSDRFPRSAKEPGLDSRHLQAGCRLGRASGLRPDSSREPLPSPRFRHRPVNFGTSSVVRPRSSLQISPDRFYSRLFLRRSPPTLLTPAARSGLEPASAGRLRGAYPHLEQTLPGAQSSA